jgi:predicted TIM-barrel fold metal-dependent hydrolase
LVNAVDTHAHIFAKDLELAAVRRYAPTYDATAEDYLKQLDANGVRGGVLVQPSFLGVNNDYLIAAIAKFPDRFRGIAVVEPDIDLKQIDAMDAAGIVGIRLNLQRLPIPKFNEGAWPKFLAHLRRLDWQVEIIREGPDLPFMIEPLLDAGVNVVCDHFGRPAETDSIDDPAFQYLLSKGKSRRVYVKLSGGYRNWPGGDAEGQGRKCAALLLKHFGPERLMWGSDWPHTQNESQVNFGATLKHLTDWVPSEADRKIILQTTPRRLFRFDSPLGA